MNRRKQRESIFKLLFRAEFYGREELEEQAGFYFDGLPDIGEADRSYIEQKQRDILDNLENIDKAVNEAAQGWKTSRMGKVDLAIIRLAVYEMKYDEDIPVKVAINEAVELSRKYGGDDSPSFVNGVLAKLL